MQHPFEKQAPQSGPPRAPAHWDAGFECEKNLSTTGLAASSCVSRYSRPARGASLETITSEFKSAFGVELWRLASAVIMLASAT